MRMSVLVALAIVCSSGCGDEDVLGKVVTWSQTGVGAPDLRRVRAVSSFEKDGKNTTVTWHVFSGASTSSEELPGLPAMFADIDPTQQLTTTPISASASYVNYSNVTGYDAARGKPFESMADIQFFPSMGDALYHAQVSKSE